MIISISEAFEDRAHELEYSDTKYTQTFRVETDVAGETVESLSIQPGLPKLGDVYKTPYVGGPGQKIDPNARCVRVRLKTVPELPTTHDLIYEYTTNWYDILDSISTLGRYRPRYSSRSRRVTISHEPHTWVTSNLVDNPLSLLAILEDGKPYTNSASSPIRREVDVFDTVIKGYFYVEYWAARASNYYLNSTNKNDIIINLRLPDTMALTPSDILWKVYANTALCTALEASPIHSSFGRLWKIEFDVELRMQHLVEPSLDYRFRPLDQGFYEQIGTDKRLEPITSISGKAGGSAFPLKNGRKLLATETPVFLDYRGHPEATLEDLLLRLDWS